MSGYGEDVPTISLVEGAYNTILNDLVAAGETRPSLPLKLLSRAITAMRGPSCGGAPKGRKFVYFAMSGAAIKIGVSADPESRVKQLSTGCQDGVRLYKTVSWLGEVGEKMLHEKFGHVRLNGEWFAYTEDLRFYVDFVQGEWAQGSGRDYWTGRYCPCCDGNGCEKSRCARPGNPPRDCMCFTEMVKV